jgi:peptidoglycan/LPS O-acetylase OafA/YrhL
VVRFFGRTSYSFYLYHPLFLSLEVPIVTAAWSSTSLEAEYPLALGLLIAVVTVFPTALAGSG